MIEEETYEVAERRKMVMIFIALHTTYINRE